MVDAQALTKKDLKTDQEVRWCPGCGDYAILNSVQGLLAGLGIPRHQTVFVSGPQKSEGSAGSDVAVVVSRVSANGNEPIAVGARLLSFAGWARAIPAVIVMIVSTATDIAAKRRVIGHLRTDPALVAVSPKTRRIDKRYACARQHLSCGSRKNQGVPARVR